MNPESSQKMHQRQRSGVLTLISLLMIGSAVIRVGLEAGPAWAKAADSDGLDNQPAVEARDVQVVLTQLLRREELLKQKEDALRDKEKALEIADQAIETRLAALLEAEENLRATLAVADKASENDLTRLTDVYQSMKPKDAAALFEAMDPTFAAGFLSRMPPDSAAAVLAGLSPQVAYTISVVMAGRNASAPKE